MDPTVFDRKPISQRIEMLLFFSWHRKREREMNRLQALNAKHFPKG